MGTTTGFGGFGVQPQAQTQQPAHGRLCFVRRRLFWTDTTAATVCINFVIWAAHAAVAATRTAHDVDVRTTCSTTATEYTGYIFVWKSASDNYGWAASW